MQIQHLLFLSGLIAGAFLLIKRKRELKYFLFLLKFGLLTALVTFLSTAVRLQRFVPENFVIVFVFIFTISFFIVFKKEILIKINELILLSFTLIFWYIFFRLALNLSFAILPFLLTIGVFFVSFTKFQLENYHKPIFYFWFLAIDIFLLRTYFIHGSLYSFVFVENIKGVSLIDSFLTGMNFLYLSCNILYFFLLFSVGGKSFKLESFRGTLKKIGKNVQPIIESYSPEQSKVLHSLILVFLQGGLLFYNYIYKLIPDLVLVNLFIAAIPFLLKKKEERGGSFLS